MSVIPQLASSLGRRDEEPNIALAKKLAESNDKKSIKEIVENLSNKKKDIQNDCIKVLYEIGVLKPSLIAGYINEFLSLLQSKNNRLQWGAMTALDAITLENPEAIFKAIPQIMKALEEGSVITRDHGVGLLIKLGSVPKYTDKILPLILEQLMTAPENQLPTYAEKALPVITSKNKERFAATLSSRYGEMLQDTKRKRMEKVIKKIRAMK